MNVTPFAVTVADAAVAALELRLGLSRWPDEVGGARDYGMPRKILREVNEYWQTASAGTRQSASSTACRNSQSRLMRACLTASRLKASTRTRLLSSSHTAAQALSPISTRSYRVTVPASNGLGGFRFFNVILPSLPGFGFSQAPVSPGTDSRAAASLWHTLMAALGYPRYFVQGGGIGAGLSTWPTRLHPAAVGDIHLSFISLSYRPPLAAGDGSLSPAESVWLAARTRWAEVERGYSHIQASKPQTVIRAPDPQRRHPS